MNFLIASSILGLALTTPIASPQVSPLPINPMTGMANPTGAGLSMSGMGSMALHTALGQAGFMGGMWMGDQMTKNWLKSATDKDSDKAVQDFVNNNGLSYNFLKSQDIVQADQLATQINNAKLDLSQYDVSNSNAQ